MFMKDLCKRTGFNKTEARFFIEELTDQIVETLRKGGEVGFGIGKFQLKNRPARLGINPSTGQRIHIGPKVVPLFKPNKKFKEAILE